MAGMWCKWGMEWFVGETLTISKQLDKRLQGSQLPSSTDYGETRDMICTRDSKVLRNLGIHVSLDWNQHALRAVFGWRNPSPKWLRNLQMNKYSDLGVVPGRMTGMQVWERKNEKWPRGQGDRGFYKRVRRLRIWGCLFNAVPGKEGPIWGKQTVQLLELLSVVEQGPFIRP